MKTGLTLFAIISSLSLGSSAFTSSRTVERSTSLGLFEKWNAGGSGNSKERLDEQWEAQQEILRNRRKPQEERNEYFKSVEKRRIDASDSFKKQWAWQSKKYGKGEDPITEWRKRREDGSISDLENQYGDPKEVGGIPIPGASFGVGGEFGVGGKFDNGGRFDLRLPYAEQGYVDEDADVMGKLASFFGGGKKKEEPVVEEPPKKKSWPW